mgnify:CR=1 FL=1
MDDLQNRVYRSQAWHLREKSRAAVAHTERDISFFRACTEEDAPDLLRDARNRHRKALRDFNYWDGYVWSWVMREGGDPDGFPEDEPVVLDTFVWV